MNQNWKSRNLQAAESWWQNSNFTANYIQEQKQKETEIWIDKDDFKPCSRLNWKKVEEVF